MLRSKLLTVLLAAASAPLWAQSDDDPPSRVARISYVEGSVAFRPGTVDDWSNAPLNYPLTTGDHLWTDPGARAEVHAGLAVIRMAPETALAILNLDDRTIQLSVSQGSVQIHVRSLEPDESFEVATPNVAVTLLRPGDYRIDSDGERQFTTVTVRGGDAAVTGGGIAFPVHARQTARIRGLDNIQEEVTAAISVDEFERWSEARDAREEQSISAQYVPREMTGYEDLDNYGTWSNNDDYGMVWEPRTVAVDWAPYRYGHWRWIEPWGWTWIDDAPWGFAPFHYGRWAQVRNVWVWVPGRRVPGYRPVYAPALVVFVGGPTWGISTAAWFPLGPREVYRPSYRVSDRYVRNVNIVHVTNVNVTNVRYVNQRVGAVSAADNATFAGGRHIGRDAARVNARDVDQAQVIGTTAHVAPRRESVVIGTRNAPPARIAERTVVVRNAPPPRPVAFETRRRVLEVNQGRPLDAAQVDTLRRQEPGRTPTFRQAGPARARQVEAAPAPPARTEPPRQEQPRFETRPQRNTPPPVAAPQPEQPRQVEQPRQIEQRRPEPPRRIETPPVEAPRQRNEQPRTEQPRTEQRRVEMPPRPEPRRPDPPARVEPPRQEQPRQVEQPRREQPRQEPRVERPAAPEGGGRGAQRERSEQKRAEKKSDDNKPKEAKKN